MKPVDQPTERQALTTLREALRRELALKGWAALDAGITVFGNSEDIAEIFENAAIIPARSTYRSRAL